MAMHSEKVAAIALWCSGNGIGVSKSTAFATANSEIQ